MCAVGDKASAREIIEIIGNLEAWDQEETAISLAGDVEKKLLDDCEWSGSSMDDVEELRGLLNTLRYRASGHEANGPEGLGQNGMSAQERPSVSNGIVRASSVVKDGEGIRVDGFLSGLKVGIPAIDRLISFCPDQVSVVTGVPGSGKSELIDAFAVSLSLRHGWKWGVFSAENPIDIHVGKLAEKYCGKPLFEGDHKMTSYDLEKAASWIDQHFFFIDSSASHTFDSILERAEFLVEHEKINGLVIDPFNYLDVGLETDAITSMLTSLHSFATLHHIHIIIVAHPQKMYRVDKGRMPTPGGMDISGSAAWFAKADLGYTVSRSEDGETEVLVWKVRFKFNGQTGFANLKFDPSCGRFRDGTNIDVIADQLRNINWGEPSAEEFEF